MSLKLRKRIVKKTIFNQNEIINETPKIENSILDKKNKTPVSTELNKTSPIKQSKKQSKKQSPKKEITKKEISKEESMKERMKKMREAKMNKKNDIKKDDVKITKKKEEPAEISIDDLFSKKNNNKTIKQTKSKITEIDLSSDED